MKPSGAAHLYRRLTVILAGTLILGGATGCAASAGAASGPNVQMATATETPTSVTAESTSADDERTCAAIGDVQTILHNAQAAFYSDRMGQDELNSWAALAARVLSNIPAADEGRVADAVAAMKDTAPDAQSLLGASSILSQEGDAPGAELLAACEAAGFTVITTGFVGG